MTPENSSGNHGVMATMGWLGSAYLLHKGLKIHE